VAAPKYSEETLNEAAEMREAGSTYAAIAKRLEMSQGAVYWHCLRLGADSPKAPPKTNVGPSLVKRGNHVVRRFSPEEDEKILRLSGEGVSLSEISRSLGRKHNSVKGRLMTLARRDERAETFHQNGDAT